MNGSTETIFISVTSFESTGNKTLLLTVCNGWGVGLSREILDLNLCVAILPLSDHNHPCTPGHTSPGNPP